MPRPDQIKFAGVLGNFRDALKVEDLAAGLIGKDALVYGPYGPQKLVYADYVASGRALIQIERFVMEEVLPYYANSHTEASFCGSFITRLRRDARAAVAACCGAGEQHATIFCGSGATAGINRLVALLGADRGRVRVIHGPYEHHSNILPWRESGAEVVEIPEGEDGGPDADALRLCLSQSIGFDRVICTLSAASNVTGIVADVARLTRIVKDAGATMVWDYAGGGPYLPIDMTLGMDAVVISPHKFIGGPGASGVMMLRRDAVTRQKPTWSGGGTVRFVSPSSHDYSGNIEAREEAGTPNVVGDIRAALAFIVKDAIGKDFMARRNRDLAQRGISALSRHPDIELLGLQSPDRLPIFSFRVRRRGGGFVHQQLVTRMLSDRYGIQARGGCACAGPYVHRLLGIDDAGSEKIRQSILAGDEMEKPGFVRMNLSVLLSDATADFILDSVADLARTADTHERNYTCDRSKAIFHARKVPQAVLLDHSA